MHGYVFKDPLWLIALAAIPLLVWLRGRRSIPVLLVPFAAAWHRPSIAALSRWPVIFGIGGLVLLVAALARPQKIEDKREVHSQGYDIMLCIDLSGSMLSEDYERNGESINRLQAIKPVIQAFIERRPADRIGVVLFSGRAYTMAPLTFDHDWLARQIERMKIGLIEPGTAIGDGLGVALTRLDQAKHETNGKRQGAFVVLLTDGSNNRGSLSPLQASDLAKTRGIPVYTIGAGRDGYVRVPLLDENLNPIRDSLGRKQYRREVSDLDETTLREIAETTGGHFFRAADVSTIQSAFRAIDKAQKIEFQAKSYLITRELFMWLAVPGAAFLLLAGLLAQPPKVTRISLPEALPIKP
jgi:Ca-activated chloride channel family protein